MGTCLSKKPSVHSVPAVRPVELKHDTWDALLAWHLHDREARVRADAEIAERLASDEMRQPNGNASDKGSASEGLSKGDHMELSTDSVKHMIVEDNLARQPEDGLPSPPVQQPQHVSQLPTRREEPTSDAEAVVMTPECPICFESLEPACLFVPPSCLHACCRPCMVRHISEQTSQPTYPIKCPTCLAPLDSQTCLDFTDGDQKLHSKLQMLILEKVHHRRIAYCANPQCATPFDVAADPLPVTPSRIRCPLCCKETCIECMTLWHENMSCMQYKTQQENAVITSLARKSGWINCPKCCHLIERRPGGCNFVKCRCGCGFCYKCGKRYVSLRSTANNSHGKPDCACGLFAIPQEQV